jgi:prephenate dehydrogenase
VIQRLAVLGLGLLGGSVAKAARAAGVAREIVAVGRDAARLEPARRDGTVDRVTTDVAAGVRGADAVVLAATVEAIERQLPGVAGAVDPDALVTDVGSTKAGIVAAAERLAAARPFAFVGSHPMAGSERSGYAVARADLFHGATVVVTPTDRTPPALVKNVSAFWEALGAGRVVLLDPPAHDRAVAAISHLPHLAAFALVEAVARFEPGAFEVAARGFKDTTRIAASDPEVWRTILLANRAAVAGSLAAFREALDALERLIAAGDAAGVAAAIARVKTRREALS